MSDGIKGVSMLAAFKRDAAFADAEVLTYPALEATAQKANSIAPDLLEEFWQAEAGSIDEEFSARKAAIGYLVLTGAQLQKTPDRWQELVSKRFTEASLELYGHPELEKATLLAARKLNKFRGYIGDPAVDQDRVHKLVDFYEAQIGPEHTDVSDEIDPSLLTLMTEIKNHIYSKYGRVLSIFDVIEERKEKVPAEEVKALFQIGIDALAQDDPSWLEWKAETSKDAAMEEDRENKTIKVGRIDRDPKKLKPLFAHEVLVHAMRSVNGSKSGYEIMSLGLPNSLDFEEGLAVLAEMSVGEDKVARKNNHYINISLALGLFGQPPISRPELQSVTYDELVVDAQANGDAIDEADLQDQAWRLMNRVYRGTLGNEVVGVNTKDISYYQGYTVAVDFMQDMLQAGLTVEEVWEYITSAVFDPTNPRHVDFIDRRSNK